MGTSEREYFAEWVCRRKMLWTGILAISLAFVVLGLLALTSVEPGSASYVVLMMDFVLAGGLVVTVGLIFWRCGYLTDDSA